MKLTLADKIKDSNNDKEANTILNRFTMVYSGHRLAIIYSYEIKACTR